MHIVLAGSMSFVTDMDRVATELRAMGHRATKPDLSELEASMHRSGVSAAETKRELGVLRAYYRIVEESDALLIVNPQKGGVSGYIGGNSFLEMGFAYVLDKPIYVLNPVGALPYSDEIEAMDPIVLDGSLERFSN